MERAWVTVVLNDESSLQALVLGNSLRRVVTMARIVVLIPPNVSKCVRNLLKKEFDGGIDVDFGLDPVLKNLELLTAAKIFTLNIPLLTKCVFLEPNTMVLQNCDELFESSTFANAAACKTLTSSDDLPFVLEPSFLTYESIRKFVKRNVNEKQILTNYFRSRDNAAGFFISEDYVKRLYASSPSSDGGDISKLSTFQKTNRLTKIIQFVGVKPWLELNVEIERSVANKSVSITNDEYCNVWSNIFKDDISPKLTTDIAACMKLNKFTMEQNISSHLVSKQYHETLKNSVAIIGLSCRYAGANTVNEFWELMKNEEDSISMFPSHRLRLNNTSEKYISTRGSFLKCPIDEFDAKFFGISPREASMMDPQQRLLTEIAWEAFENAAVNFKDLRGSNTAVYNGIWTKPYEALVEQNATGADFHRVVLGNAFSATSARISFTLGLNGPNIATESGCSSSMVSLHLACESLRRRETNMALVGGVNLLLTPFPQEDMLMLSNDGRCKTFDTKADGFGRGEGCAAIVLKRYSDAVRDGDIIRAIIRGSAVSSDGMSTSFGTPSKYCQEVSIKKAVESSGVEPDSVDYVEAHGTGTPIGDPTEIAAIAAVYTSKDRKEPLVIGSVKTNIGHSESAAGLAGIIKVILSMKHEYIPAHLNFESLNPMIDLDSIPAKIPLSGYKWPKTDGKSRISGVSSFGISGTNVHVILEEPPKVFKPIIGSFSRSHHILILSAKSELALMKLSSDYSEYLDNSKELGSVAFTANTSRAVFKHRLAVIGKDSSEVKNQLKEGMVTKGIVRVEKSLTAFLFTGHGSQYVGMGKVLYYSHPVFKMAMDECAELAENYLPVSLIEILWGESVDNLYLDKTICSQVSILCIEYSLFQLWKSFGVNPDIVLGHSAGEFAAAVAAGVLSLNDAIMLVCERGALIQNLSPGQMMAIRLSHKEVARILVEFHRKYPNLWLDIAVVNSETQVVVAGMPDSVKQFSIFCSQHEFKTHILASDSAFHSREMTKILTKLEIITNQITYNSPKCDYISSFTGSKVNEFSSKYWLNHTRESVNFPAALKLVQAEGCKIFVEVGPQPVLLSLAMSNLTSDQVAESIFLPSIRKNEDNWFTVLTSLSKLFVNGVDIDWRSFDFPYKWQKVELPTYPFQRQKFWLESTSDSESIFYTTKHPLLGDKLSTMLKDHVYYKSLDLNELPYLKDHQVVDTIILPGAAYLEIILAAGRDIIQNGTIGSQVFYMMVENFVIEAPLVLEVGKNCGIQVVASPTEKNNCGGFFVSIYNKCEVTSLWKCYASATVSSKLKNMDEPKMSIVLAEVKNRCGDPILASDLYQRCPEIGIIFGDTFQSITHIWKGNNEVVAEIPVPVNAGNMKEYVYHPIILDAMIQAFGLNFDVRSNDLYLPLAIGKFDMISMHHPHSPLIAHVIWESGQLTADVTLYDESGKILAKMSQIRIVRTSKTAFSHVITSQKKKLPDMFQEVWRTRDGPMHSRIDISAAPSNRDLLILMNTMSEELTEAYNVYVKVLWPALNKQLGYIIFRIFCKLGWKPEIGRKVNLDQILVDLKIIPQHKRFICLLLEVLTEVKFLSSAHTEKDIQEWYVECIPTMIEVESHHESNKFAFEESAPIEYAMLLHCEKHIVPVLQGKSTGVAMLFSDNSSVDMTKLYSDPIPNQLGNSIMKDYLQVLLQNQNSSNGRRGVVRILEVGAGTGATSVTIFKALQESNIPFRYTFTDIAVYFLSEAAKNYKHVPGVEYMTLDIEKDPKLQGFFPYQYDIIIASNVLHATENITKTVQNIRHLLVPSGVLLIQEMTKPIRIQDFIFGSLEGYWRFNDLDLRTTHPSISYEKWEMVLQKCGLYSMQMSPNNEGNCIIAARASAENPKYFIPTANSCSDKTCWIIFLNEGVELEYHIKKSLENCGETIITVHAAEKYEKVQEHCYTINSKVYSDVDQLLEIVCKEYGKLRLIYFWGMGKNLEQNIICGNLLQVCRHLMSSKSLTCPKIFVVTRGVHYIGDQTPGDPAAATLWGILKTTLNERQDMLGCAIDLDPGTVDYVAEGIEVLSQLWLEDSEFQVAFRKNKRHVLRVLPTERKLTPLVIPNDGRYFIGIPETNAINDIKLHKLKQFALEENEIEVAVKAAALNFRDILVIIKPSGYHTLVESVGSDFAGIVTKVGFNVNNFQPGDKVFGMTSNGAVGSHVVVKSHTVLPKPHTFTFASASTLPSVFLTAFYCLHNVAQLKKGETILIHVASGGVGLIAIQIAKKIGANIVATAGNNRKREYLRSLGITHVFHSRDTSYGEGIERYTNGVDVILNSLTGPNFKETSLRVCKTNGRFVEMGKVNIWEPDTVMQLRPDVTYTIIDLEKLTPQQYESMFKEMQESVSKGEIETLPYTRFDVTQTHEALNHFLKAHHIGKVVVTMPEIKLINGKTVINEQLFNDESTYLITGGLGGLGLEMTKWMLSCGAKYIVLVGRSSPDTKTLETLNTVNQKNCVLTMNADIGNIKQCIELFTAVKDNKRFPPLRGIFHAAGTLSDGTVVNQTWEKFQKVFNAKVNGAWNLHLLVKDIELEYFVLFSSVTCNVGSMGQCNHVAANMFMDSLVHYRQSFGLPAQTIDWGAWSDIGSARNYVDRSSVQGMKYFSSAEGISALKYILSHHITQTIVTGIDSLTMQNYLRITVKYADELSAALQSGNSIDSEIECDIFWREIAPLSENERIEYINRMLEGNIRTTLRLSSSEDIDPEQTFSEMGLDSLMAVEIRNQLQRLIGKRININPTTLMDHPTVNGLSKYLTRLTITSDLTSVTSHDSETQPSTTFNIQDSYDLVRKDSILPFHIQNVGSCCRPSEVRTILLTGSTGTLGPYILNELVRSGNFKIYCLIRGKKVEAARKKLASTLKKINLHNGINMDKISILVGNITELKLGLSDSDYNNMAENVDAIINCAVKSNHLEQYKKNKLHNDIRSVNALGVLNILELASTVKTKLVLHGSSAAAINEFTDDGYLADDFMSSDNHGEGIDFGYALSKIVGEKLCAQAISRGIPCMVLRYTAITGHSKSGRFLLGSDHFIAFFLTCLRIGVIPSGQGGLYSIPVDIAAKLSLKILFNDEADVGVYNITNPRALTVEMTQNILSMFGRKLRVVDNSEFSYIVQSEGSNSLLSAFMDMYSQEGKLIALNFPLLQIMQNHDQSVFRFSEKIVKAVPNIGNIIPHPSASLKLFMEYARDTGVFKSVGIHF